MENKETKQNKVIQYQESDYQSQLRLSTLLSILSDLATQNAYEIELWNDELAKHYGWVLIKQTLKFKRPIYTGEPITLSTRAYHSSRVQFTRQYQIENQSNVICNGHSVWTLIDLEKRSIARINKIGLKQPEIKDYPYFLTSYQDIDETIPTTLTQTRKVLYSDIDVNQHMNNSRYIEWAFDVIEPDVIKNCFVEEVSMWYKKEIPPYSNVDIYYGRKDHYVLIIMKNHDSGVECFHIGITFKEII